MLWVVLVLLVIVSLFIGVGSLSLKGLINLDETALLLLFKSRIPRTVSIIFAGIGMSVSGIIMQQLSRNKFVSPSTAATLDSAKFGVLISMLLFVGSSIFVRMTVSFVVALLGTFLFMRFVGRINAKNKNKNWLRKRSNFDIIYTCLILKEGIKMVLALISDSALWIVALCIFLATYVCLLTLPKYRVYVALLSALVFIILGILPFGDILGKINFNVLMMIAGTMGIVALFIESKMPALLADIIISKVPTMKWATILLSIFAGVISAFVDNVATVLMIAPVALTIAKKLEVSPVPSLICISIASNLQGAATLVGDTTSILLGGDLDMSFIDFFWYHGRPGLFFINQAGMIASTLVLLFIFRKDKMPIDFKERTEVKDYVPTILLLGMIVLLILASLINIPEGFVSENINGLIVMFLLLVGLVYRHIKTKDFKGTANILKEIDFFTLGLLLGLFIIIGGLEKAGVITRISELIAKASGDSLFLAYTIIVWISVLLSAFIDNIPYVMTMLPVVSALGISFGFPEQGAYVLYFGLLVGATLGGNLTPIGASANITTIGILRKEGYEVKAKTFMKYSVPFTLAAVTTGYILTWLLFSGIGK